MKDFLSKFHLERYVSYKLILLIDLIMSATASMLSLFFLKLLLQSQAIDLKLILLWLMFSLVASFVMFFIFRTYHSIIRHATLRDSGKFAFAILGKELMLAVLYVLPDFHIQHMPFLLFLDFSLSMVLLFMVRVSMIIAYDYVRSVIKHDHNRMSILVYGTHDKSVALAKRLLNSSHYNVVGYVNHGTKLKTQTINDMKIYYFLNEESVVYFKEKLEIDAILFATDSDARNEQDDLIKLCSDYQLKVLLSPGINEVVDGKIINSNIREINIEDLLGRPEIEISMSEVIDNFSNKTIMVTGAAGSIGSELCRQLAHMGVDKLILYDNAETPMHNLRLELEETFPELNFVPIIGDVRLVTRLDFAFRTYKPDVVFHAAAYKHVPLMEENPCEAVLVNVVGSRNVANKCIEYNVEKMVMISTDKAVNPTNIMGCTKRLAEIYVQSLGLAIEEGKIQGNTKFVTTRFGNVLGSNGSVIPRFREQILHGGPVTVTHPKIVRFFMTIPEACRLVMEAATMTDGNQIFVFDMGESVKIDTLARRMISLAGFIPDKDIKIEYTGLRPGEKLYEEVLADTENTIPTKHNRIRIAKVRDYDFTEAKAIVDQLEDLSRAVLIPDMVRLMKKTVPEYKSKNSKFEMFDC